MNNQEYLQQIIDNWNDHDCIGDIEIFWLSKRIQELETENADLREELSGGGNW